MGRIDLPAGSCAAFAVNDLRDTCQGDRAADRAASAARTLAAIAHDAARKYVKRDVVASQHHGYGVDMMERERQNRLRRWHELPHPNRKVG